MRPFTRLEFNVGGMPKPQPRPRAVKRGEFAKIVSTLKGSPASYYKQAINLACRLAMSGTALPTGPLGLLIQAVWVRPGDMKKHQPQARLWRSCQREDADNIAKAVMDAMLGVAYQDDSLVADLRVQKFYGRVGEAAHTHILLVPKFKESGGLFDGETSDWKDGYADDPPPW